MIPNPANYPIEPHPPTLSPVKLLGNNGKKHVLLAVGRLDYQKGFDLLLQAFSAIKDAYPDWVLIILGEGDMRGELVDMAREMGIAEKVYLPGNVGNVGEWYSAADVYVLASRFEGFPNTLVESMAYGVATIATDCETGPREIVSHQIDGVIVPKDDPEALATELGHLMSHPELRDRYAKNAIKIREKLSMQKVAILWENAFHDG